MPMQRRLVINADDFGLTAGVNRAVVELHRAGALLSATLMATGTAYEDAVEKTRQNLGLGVGCHIVLTDGTPVLAPKAIPSLMGKDRRRFRPSLPRFILAVLLRRVKAAEITSEAEAQIRRLQATGIHVTHIDTHKHTHVFPFVARALLTAMQRTGVRAIRNPFEPEWSLRLGPASGSRRLLTALARRLRHAFEQLPAFRDRRVFTTDGTIGVSATGHLDAALLRLLLEHLPPGTWELVCHPGYNDRDLEMIVTRLRSTRETEREALLEAFTEENRAGSRADIELIHYGDLS